MKNQNQHFEYLTSSWFSLFKQTKTFQSWQQSSVMLKHHSFPVFCESGKTKQSLNYRCLTKKSAQSQFHLSLRGTNWRKCQVRDTFWIPIFQSVQVDFDWDRPDQLWMQFEVTFRQNGTGRGDFCSSPLFAIGSG